MITNKSPAKIKHSLLWRLSNQDAEAFIAGTMHIPFRGYESIVSRFKRVLDDQSITAYFGETDMNEMSDHVGSLTSNFIRLSDQMSCKRFESYRKKLMHFTGLDLLQFDLIPPMLFSSLIATKLLDSRGKSIDEILWKYAEQKNIPVSGLETIEEQMEIFHKIPYDYQVKQLKHLLANLTKGRKSLHQLSDLYKAQNIHQLYMQGKKTLGPIRSLMLKDRNIKMVDRMIEQLSVNTEGPKLFTCGAAHLAGEHGILHRLKEKGCALKPYITQT